MKFERYAAMAAAVGLVLIFSLIAWLGIAGPIWRASWTATPAEWLGFAGNLVGGLMTILAATVAWFAVQAQIREQRRSVESQRRDMANAKLTEHALAVFDCFAKFLGIFNAGDAERREAYDAFIANTQSREVLALLVDPLMGKDANMVALFINSMKRAAAGKAKIYDRADPDGRYELLATLLYDDLTNNIPERRQVLLKGTVDDLSGLALIDHQRFADIRQTGQIP